ncbi:FAD-dependent monooxygenase [Caulobacter sp. UNC279MFTsu5.1]|uniref:FAD-dependent monooxygenase n=1 Tax=Caulobacter sp. UNC279MFTsu5.1 TaxID=1502775 RepID=UPI000364F1B5|nr:FAD-dependent monooxygenase [Caulobacter sp. UNC279MFTsu5.1]SFI56712.1 2-polyprenyl-6-methoxyphenol hydroxylase [Caulobacter sp. UNC279MFTsu5.1]
MTTSDMLDVLIVGAGPTGSALGIDLARRGLRFRIIDKAAHSFDGSRAKGLQPRSLEVLEDLGVYDAIAAAAEPYPLVGLHLGPLVLPWRMMAKSKPTAAIPFPNMLLIPQFHIDPALHDRLRAAGQTISFDTELKSLSQTADHVEATLSRKGQAETVRARYLVGADGGGSLVRQTLDIDFAGSTDEEDRMIIVDAVTSGLSRDRWHVWPGPAGKFMAACPLPHTDLFQWMIRLRDGETPDLALEAINERIRVRAKSRSIAVTDVRWSSVFRPNIRLAQAYRQGRVFLAGDAAHVHPPTGAQGLNTGIQDAYNLGWKLAQVLAGADPILLDSYQAERRAVAQAVLALATKNFEGLATADPAAMKRGRDESQLAITYRDGPLVAASAQDARALSAGDRAPDAILKENGKATRLFQRLAGPQFTAIAYGDQAARDLAALGWPRRGAGLKRIAINTEDRYGFDHRLVDHKGTFRKAYGLSDDAIVLVRPDGYIAHLAGPKSLASLKDIIRRVAPSL